MITSWIRRTRPHRLIAVVLLLAPALAGAQGHYQSDQAQCRLSFGNSVRDLAALTALRVEICHRLRLIGDLAPTTECNDPSSWELSYPKGHDRVTHDLERFAKQSAFCSPGVTTPAEVGFTACPAPCAGLPVGTFPELGECLRCVTAAGASTTLTAAHGTPTAPSSKLTRKCLENVGRGIVRYLNKRMLHQHECQFLQDIEEPGFVGVDCRDTNNPLHPEFARSQRAVEKLRKQIDRRCAAVDIATELDTCGSDPASVHACVIASVDQWTQDLADALYPPLP